MRLVSSSSASSIVLALALLSPAFAQWVPPPPPPTTYGPAALSLSQQLATLSDQPATHTGFTFDRSMMQFAQNLLESNGMDAHRAAAAITGITVDSFHYRQPAFYTPEAMEFLLEGYRASGWKHLVNGKQTPANTAQPRAMATDLWLHFTGSDIDALMVLTRGSLMMNAIQITGDLRPLDLLHLSGHFGIPKVDPDAVMVPEDRARR